MASAGRKFLAAVLKENDLPINFVKMDSLFKEGEERDLYEYIKEFFQKHGELPKQDALDEIGFISPEVTEPKSYYEEQLRKRYLDNSLRSAVEEAAGPITNGDPALALSLLSKTINTLSLEHSGKDVYSFKNASEVVIPEYKKTLSDEHVGIELGWATLDNMSGGLIGGDLISIVGRPAMGKSWMLLWSALHAWSNQKQPVMFVTMEMSPMLIMQRLTSMYLKTPFGLLKSGSLSSKKFKEVQSGLLSMAETDLPEFWIVDGNMTATVSEVYTLSSQLKPSVLFIDGGYLLEHQDKNLGIYGKVAENARLMKLDLATGGGIPVIVSWQFNRDVPKLKKTEKVGLEHIGHSDAIGQLSSLVLGLFQDESVSTLKTRKVDVLKGRSGEIGEFSVAWDFLNMGFGEIKLNLFEDLQFLV